MKKQNRLKGFGEKWGMVLVWMIPLLISISLVGAVSADNPEPVPRDMNGLPLWEIAQWHDFPVRLDLAGPEELARLLAEVPLASFSREQISPADGAGGRGRLVFEPRITEAEATALQEAGYIFKRLVDQERESRQAAERVWAVQGLKSAVDLKRAPAGYYPTHAQIGSIFAQMEIDYPGICRTFTWGSSVQGRQMWGLVISADPHNTAPEPEVRLSSTMHGDEPPGMVMLMNFAEYLTANYGVAGFEDVTNLVDNYEIHIMPLHNPDGYVAGTRSNANGVDLNRNFLDPAGTHTALEPENVQFTNYAGGQHFVISENGHSGALVVNYPWDYQLALTPDDAAIINLSLEYSTYNLPMYNGSFPQGITNGAQWYIVYGSLQDWSYYSTGCIDVTIEYDNVKFPPASQLDGLWDDNRESLLHFVKAARYGIGGVVTDSGTGLPLDATVTVVGNSKQVVTDPAHGDYYKLLDTGTYDLVFEADGYVTKTETAVATVWGTPTVLDVALEADVSDVPGRPASKVMLTAAPNPFNPSTEFTITHPGTGRVTLDVYDLQGRRVRRLLDGYRVEGGAEIAWNGLDDQGRRASSGVYFALMKSGGQRAWVKVVLVK
ncbi:MAG: M14 family zinc carboxypeptidase [Candidatus Krumholzibacteriota bacterium]